MIKIAASLVFLLSFGIATAGSTSQSGSDVSSDEASKIEGALADAVTHPDDFPPIDDAAETSGSCPGPGEPYIFCYSNGPTTCCFYVCTGVTRCTPNYVPILIP